MSGLIVIAQPLVLVAALVMTCRPLGNYMARVFTAPASGRIESAFYRLVGVDPTKQQTWRRYVSSIITFSVLGIVLLYVVLRLQHLLPTPWGAPSMAPLLSLNTAISFVSNTNWQSFVSETLTPGESQVGFAAQMVGLTTQNFVSAAVGLTVAIVLMRGFAGVGVSNYGTTAEGNLVGNFWVDVTRALAKILIPLALIAATLLVAGGAIQNFGAGTEVTTLTGQTAWVPGGPAASQAAIAHLGNNGGGFFAANSAFPLVNPNAWTNLLSIYLMLVIPLSLPTTFGQMLGNRRQGRVILAAMVTIMVLSTTGMVWAEMAGGSLQGKETRFGILGSSLFASVTTLTSTGATNSAHGDYTTGGSFLQIFNMSLGEIAPGGIGTGFASMLIIAVLAVFLAGLLVGQSPQYLGKKIRPPQITMASLYILVAPILALAGVALTLGIPPLREAVLTSTESPTRAVTELLYDFLSTSVNNGSSYGDLQTDTTWFTIAFGATMFLGRFVPIALTVALAGSLVTQTRSTNVEASVLPTDTPLFAGLLVGTSVIVSALTFLPALVLGPIAEGLIR